MQLQWEFKTNNEELEVDSQKLGVDHEKIESQNHVSHGETVWIERPVIYDL